MTDDAACTDSLPVPSAEGYWEQFNSIILSQIDGGLSKRDIVNIVLSHGGMLKRDIMNIILSHIHGGMLKRDTVNIVLSHIHGGM